MTKTRWYRVHFHSRLQTFGNMMMEVKATSEREAEAIVKNMLSDDWDHVYTLERKTAVNADV